MTEPKTTPPVTHAYLMMLADRLAAAEASRTRAICEDKGAARIAELEEESEKIRETLDTLLERYRVETIERVEARLSAA